MMEKLAILGGKASIQEKFAPYRSMSSRERQAVIEVMDSDCLSGFYGSWGDQFLGGPKVRAFESAWSRQFGCRYSIAVNSATSALMAAVGAAGIGPGDEVIVPAYTMSATAIAILAYGGIPIFVDIEEKYFCLDFESVEAAITRKTKAIIVVNLFGHPAELHRLRTLAEAHKIKLIEDNSQAPFSRENDRFSGTIGHIGVFSLNYHKHIHTGEGGVCVTDDDELAIRLQLIRNHGENVVEHLSLKDITNLIGFNYRMTELSAAIGLVQLDRSDEHIEKRAYLAERLTSGTNDLEGLHAPVVRTGCTHVYYTWSVKIDSKVLGISRRTFSRALAAEGVPHGVGYVRPLYLLPVFQKRVALGSEGYPFNLGSPNYDKGICPIAERMYERDLLSFEVCAYDVGEPQLEQIVSAIRKVHASCPQLMEVELSAQNGK
jgi:dTDP-4-amino-4,6-dideoxygalactose transaminase